MRGSEYRKTPLKLWRNDHDSYEKRNKEHKKSNKKPSKSEGENYFISTTTNDPPYKRE